MKIHADKGNGQAKCGATPWGRMGALWIDSTYTRNLGYKVNCKRCLGTVKKNARSAEIKENMIGKIFHTSWGYDMTINEYAKVIEQSPKSILLQECTRSVRDDYGRGAGRATTLGTLKPDGEKFRLYKKVRTNYNGTEYETWAGGGEVRYWSEWDGKESYHNTWD